MTCYLIIALIPPILGLFEFSWGTGLISAVAFYLAFKEIFLDSSSVLLEQEPDLRA